MKWMDRQWSFPYETPDCRISFERLKSTAGEIRLLIADKNPAELKEITYGKWSVHDHVGHLLTMESLWIARLDDLVMGKPTLRAWNGTNADTEAALFNSQRLGKIVDDFEEIRNNHLRYLEPYLSRASELSAWHERLSTTMNLADHLFFMAEHDAHHLAIISNIVTR